MQKTQNLYQIVTDKIVTQLEAGVAPWVKPWSTNGSTGGNLPVNAVSNRRYTGVNVFLLWGSEFPTNRWLTFKQAKDAGGTVRGGEKGTHIFFVSAHVKPDRVTGEDVRIPFLKSYTVFNVAQCDGLSDKVRGIKPVDLTVEQVEKAKIERVEAAEAFVKATGADIRHGGDRAYYNHSDFIQLPVFESFVTADSYYSTAFHELTHWTGDKKRLDRTFGARFGDQTYAAEELVAELSAAYLSADFGFDTVSNSASYIQSWIKLLKSDNRAIFTAASKAQKAADFLRAFSEEAEAEEQVAEAA